MTITLSQIKTEDHLVLRVHRDKAFSEKSADELFAIFSAFQENYVDPTSVVIGDWILNTIEIKPNGHFQFNDYFLESPRECMDILINQIMVDRFLPGYRLVNPVLVNNWTCEKLFIEASKVTNKGVPFTLVPHEYILKIQKWAQEFTASDSKELTAYEGQTQVNIEELLKTKDGQMLMSCYAGLVKTALTVQTLQNMTATAQQGIAELQTLRENLETENRERAEQLQRRAEEREAQVEARIESEIRRHHEVETELQTRIDRLEQQYRELRSETDQLKARSNDHDLEIARLRQAIAYEMQRRAALEAMQNQGKKKKGGCVIS